MRCSATEQFRTAVPARFGSVWMGLTDLLPRLERGLRRALRKGRGTAESNAAPPRDGRNRDRRALQEDIGRAGKPGGAGRRPVDAFLRRPRHTAAERLRDRALRSRQRLRLAGGGGGRARLPRSALVHGGDRKDFGGSVRRGQRGTPVLALGTSPGASAAAVARAYLVFNAQQCGGLIEWVPETGAPRWQEERARRILHRSGARIEVSRGRARTLRSADGPDRTAGRGTLRGSGRLPATGPARTRPLDRPPFPHESPYPGGGRRERVRLVRTRTGGTASGDRLDASGGPPGTRARPVAACSLPREMGRDPARNSHRDRPSVAAGRGHRQVRAAARARAAAAGARTRRPQARNKPDGADRSGSG